MQTNALTRPDTMFGVCQAIGDDFGFNPFYLRLVLGGFLLWSPLAVIGVYAALGLIVGVSHLLFREPRAATAEAETVDHVEQQPEFAQAA
jgi:phage shock protein C